MGAPVVGETTDLAALLAACTVRLGGEGMAGGTGFFVAPGWVVTCAHVVEGRTSDQVRVHWGMVEGTGRVVAQHPERRPHGSATYPFPDLALVRVPGLAGHGCVWLEDAIPALEARLHTYGFTKTWSPTQPGGEPATFTFEGLQEVEGGRLLKFSAGEAVPGMSGGPLLDLGSGRVCGVVKTTRDADSPRGGWAIPIGSLRERHPEVWVAHDQFHARDGRWRSLAEGWMQLAELLLEPPPLRSDREGPSALLRPEFQVVGFHGRAELLDQLEGWCLEPGGLGLRLVTGPGGQGKTRLAHQLCARLTAHGWLAGPLQRGELTEAAVSRLQAASVACLLVVDYAETRIDQLGRLLDGLAGRARAGPVRLLLLARSAGDWWADFGRSSPRRRSITDGVVQTELLPLDDTLQGRQQAYAEAVAAFARQLHLPPPASSPPPLADPAYELILNLHIAALADVLEASGDDHRDRSDDPIATVLDHEQRYWHDSAQAAGLGQTYEQVDLDRAVAAATLCGAQDEAQAVALVRCIPNLPGPDQAVRLARLLRRLYPSRSGYWAPLQPDLLGEELIAQVASDPVVAGGPSGLLAALLADATDQQVQRALTVLVRATPRHPHLREALAPVLQADPERLLVAAVRVATQARDPEPLVAALRQVLHNLQDSPLILELEGQLPQQSLALGDLAVEITRLALSLHRRQAQPDPAEITRLLDNLSVRLSQMGRREEALAASQEAVAAYRQLAEAAPDGYLPHLAPSLTNLSNHLSDMGRRGEALAAVQEAVAVYRRLAKAAPDAFLPDLATSLNNLSIRLGSVGPWRWEEGLAASQEAVALHRRLAEAAPDTFLPDLAISLNNLAIHLSQVGRGEEALAPIQEAVAIFRRLAKATPDAFLPRLAGSLDNLAMRLSEVGRQGEALAPSQEAVAAYRRLAETAPDAFRPDLARSLNTLALRLSEAGRGEEALAASHEAVAIRRRLAEAVPAAFLRDLSRSLRVLAQVLAALDREEEAAQVLAERESLFWQWNEG